LAQENYVFQCFNHLLEGVGRELLGDNFLVAIEEVNLRRGDDIVHLMPVDVGLAAIEVEPIEVVFADELVPFGAGGFVWLAEDGKGSNVAAVAVLLILVVKLGDHLVSHVSVSLS
jgi:hypothetical protein